jgi:hypothetical protein
MDVDVLLEHYRKQLGITEEQEQQLIEEHRGKNPVVLLEKEVKAEIVILDERAKGMQEIDEFTLTRTFLIDDRTEGMKEIDDFTLGVVFELMARIEVLEQEVQTLKGGK